MTTIRIMGFDYTVFVESNTEIIKDRMGLTDFDRQIIYIYSGLSPEMKVSTLLHEILEAINFHMEMKLEHRQISCIESGFFQVLSDNNWNLESVIYDAENPEIIEWS